MGFLGRCLSLAFSSPLLHTSLSPQYPPPPPPPHVGSSKTPREFLSELPPGPYTCLRGKGLALLGFDFHLNRLQQGMRASGLEQPEQELRQSVLSAVEDSIMAVLRHSSQAYDVTDEFDTFVTVHAAASSPGGPVKLSVHSLPMPYVSIPEPVTLEVRGEGRAEPEVKHSQWLWDRQPLERYRVGAGGEVVLSRRAADGRRELLEGLVTNLMVVQEGVLLTAGEGVLKGHIREMLIQAAREFGFKVEERAPALDDMDKWEEVFITGSGRLIVPVNRIQGTTVGIVPKAFNAPGPITNQLRHRLLYDMAKGWTPIDTLRRRHHHHHHHQPQYQQHK